MPPGCLAFLLCQYWILISFFNIEMNRKRIRLNPSSSEDQWTFVRLDDRIMRTYHIFYRNNVWINVVKNGITMSWFFVSVSPTCHERGERGESERGERVREERERSFLDFNFEKLKEQSLPRCGCHHYSTLSKTDVHLKHWKHWLGSIL